MRITIQALAHDELSVSFVWLLDGAELFRYSADRSLIKRQCVVVRAQLSDMAGALNAEDADRIAKLEVALPSLAREGGKLFEALFAAPSDSDNRDVRDSIEEMLGRFGSSEQAAPCSILVMDASGLGIPWGLLWTPASPPFNASGLDPETYGNFWAIKYELGCVPLNVAVPTANSVARSLEGSRTDDFGVFGVDGTPPRPILRIVQEEEDLTEAAWISAPVFDDYKSFEESWYRPSCAANRLIYLFGHTEDNQVYGEPVRGVKLYDGKFLDHQQLFFLTTRLSRENTGMIFVNGCGSAIRDDEASWFKAAWRHGLQGLVGTEERVPIIDGWRFGHEVCRQFYVGGSRIGDVLRRVRMNPKLFPVGLLYGLYCHPDLTLAGAVNNLVVPASVVVPGQHADGKE